MKVKIFAFQTHHTNFLKFSAAFNIVSCPFTKAESNHSRVSLVLVKRTKRYRGNLVFFREPNAEFLVR